MLMVYWLTLLNYCTIDIIKMMSLQNELCYWYYWVAFIIDLLISATCWFCFFTSITDFTDILVILINLLSTASRFEWLEYFLQKTANSGFPISIFYSILARYWKRGTQISAVKLISGNWWCNFKCFCVYS